MTKSNTLTKSIENLYKTFSHYSIPGSFDACPCCVKNSDQLILKTKPLQHLTEEELSHYTFKAITTWGSEDDFRYFLPRILELISESKTGELGMSGPEIIFGKLITTGWKQWQKSERISLTNFFHENWKAILYDYDYKESFYSKYDYDSRPESWLCGLSIAGENLQFYIENWIEAKTSSAYDHLTSFLKNSHYVPFYFGSSNEEKSGYWSRAPHAAKKICNFLFSAETSKKLNEILLENADCEYREPLTYLIKYRQELMAR